MPEHEIDADCVPSRLVLTLAAHVDVSPMPMYSTAPMLIKPTVHVGENHVTKRATKRVGGGAHTMLVNKPGPALGLQWDSAGALATTDPRHCASWYR